MEFREISAFLQVARLKSFSKAAKQLGYSQAAVTIQVKQLEKELGVHLFDRIGKQIVLTHQGTVFYDYASGIMRDLAHAKDAVSTGMCLTGRLCVGTIESICASVFPGLLKKYHEEHPEASVSIVIDSPEVLLDKMNAGALDLVCLLDKRMYDPRWVKELEEPEDVFFVTKSGHPLAGESTLSMDQIIGEPFLLTEKNASYRLILDQYLAASGKRIQPFLEIGNTEFILRLLKDGAGLSFLPKYTVAPEINAGTISVLNVGGFYLRVWRQILHHKDKWVTREMAAFIDLAKNTGET